ncbi:Hypothetical predicted protein [Paramuricea clavata]|uniref:Uncharacterized protein n=1 Tax=Paramuricea clavata TaxID=317549 RepID=A0A7D9JKX9_PARCT|nr:Hypothetical predicted protein [Paramuricea clavata]
MENAKKKHSTTMREFRELEKRLLNLEREHNKLIRQRNFYCKSASSTRPYLAEKIAAKLRPQTASLPHFKKASVKESSTGECVSKEMEKSAGFDGKWADIDIGRRTEEFETKPTCNVQKDGDDLYAKNEIFSTRITSSRASFRTCSRNSSANNGNAPLHYRNYSANNRNHNRPPSVGSRHSSAHGRNSSAHSRSLPSEISHLGNRRNKSWVYQPMPIHPERQSIYTLVVPPVHVAEESKKRLKKRKRQGGGGRHVAWMDNREHVLRFQGIPRDFYVHDKKDKNTENDMDKLKHCRYLR